MNFAFEGGDKSPHSKLLADYDYKIPTGYKILTDYKIPTGHKILTDYKILTGYKWVAVYARAVRCDLALKPRGHVASK